MSELSELKTELRSARQKLQWMRPVAWTSPIAGMSDYGDQLAVVTRLTNELNRLTNQGRAS